MEESLLNANLFRHSFIVALVVGILCRGLVLRVTDKQYPSRPQDYLEQIIISGLSASLGAIALPALIDKEFAALTFFCSSNTTVSRSCRTRKNNTKEYR